MSACICPDGYEGNLCERDIDECLLNPNICVNGICVNQPGTFKCYCEPGKFWNLEKVDPSLFEIPLYFYKSLIGNRKNSNHI